MTSLDDVKQFWNSNPLWTGESKKEPGSREFFDEHRAVYISDCFAGQFDVRFYPPLDQMDKKCKSWISGAGLAFGQQSLACAVWQSSVPPT